jgi:hypothetical protein
LIVVDVFGKRGEEHMVALTRGQPPTEQVTDEPQLRRFGLLLGMLFLILFDAIPFVRHRAVAVWPWLVATMLWTMAVTAPRALRLVHRGWVRVGESLGWLNTRVILSLLYFAVILPTGVVMRLMGRDPMRRKFEPAANSYRVPAKPRRQNHLEQPY